MFIGADTLTRLARRRLTRILTSIRKYWGYRPATGIRYMGPNGLRWIYGAPSFMRSKKVLEVSALASTLNPLSPVMPLWKATQWLTDYFAKEPPFTPGDNLGTCYSSFAAVMLSAMVLGTESPVILAGVTSYPAPFVAAVIVSMRRGDVWSLPKVRYLRTLVETIPSNCPNLPGVLNDAMESVWWVVETVEMRIALESLRQGILFGGGSQRWLDGDAAEYFDLV